MRGKEQANGVYLRLKRACDAPEGLVKGSDGLQKALGCRSDAENGHGEPEGLPKKGIRMPRMVLAREQGDGFEFIQDSLKMAEMGLFRAFPMGCGSLMVTIW